MLVICDFSVVRSSLLVVYQVGLTSWGVSVSPHTLRANTTQMVYGWLLLFLSPGHLPLLWMAEQGNGPRVYGWWIGQVS